MLKTLVCAGALVALASPAAASVVVVQAQANSSSGGSGVVFGPVTAGQSLVVGSSTDDLWSAGALPRYSDANGLTGDRFATASDDSGQPVGTLIGTNFGIWSQDGFNAPFGALVGRIGTVYQLLGANYNGSAWGTGNLELFYWDANSFDNFGEISFSIRAGAGGVPEPSTWLLAILGFGFIGMAMRTTAKRRVSVAYT